jgi:hypothetical protein
MDQTLPPTAPPSSDRAVMTVGVALLTAALVLSTLYTRDDGDLDWTNYLVGIAATLVLLGIAAVARLRALDEELVSWPGALGIMGVGSMLGLALDDASATAYVVGVVVLGLSVGGYLLNRGWPFVLSAIGGFGLVYAKIVDDVFDASDFDGDNVGMVIGIALVIFAVLVTVATWLLPERVLGGVVAGSVVVFGNFAVLAALAAAAQFQATFFVTSSGDMDFGDEPSRFDGYDNDIWVILVLSLLLVLGWAWCAWQTEHVGFRVLMIATCATILPMATVSLAVEHPSRWGAVIGVLGAGALGVLLLGKLQPRQGN